MTTEAPVESAAKTQLREYVDRGAALLDRHMPGWAQKLDADTLHMEGCTRCVLGQVYGDYGAGLSRLWECEGRWPTGEGSGFDLPMSFRCLLDEDGDPIDAHPHAADHWLALGELWVEKAKERVG